MSNPSWFSVTTSALEAWNAAQRRYWSDVATNRCMPDLQNSDRFWLTRARYEYRRLILSWYRTLLTPMKVGDVVPSEVALLIAEDWDERTAWVESNTSKVLP